VVIALVVAILLSRFGDLLLHGCRVSRAGQSADIDKLPQALLDQEEQLRSSLGQFGILEMFLACSHREDVAWSGGDVVSCVVFTFFVKVSLWVTSDQVKLLLTHLHCVGYPRFCVSQPHVFVVFGVCPDNCVVPLRSVSSVLDTLTPVLELYVQLRERRQRAATCVELVLRLVACSALVVEGVVLVGLHSSLACACGAAVGPFIRDYETERYLFLVVHCVPVFFGVVVKLCSVEVAWFCACDRDKGLRRVTVATALVVVISLSRFGGLHLLGCCVSCAGQSADINKLPQALLDQEELLRSSLGRFGILEVFLARSHCEDVAWSGGDAVPCVVFAFFIKTSVRSREAEWIWSLIGHKYPGPSQSESERQSESRLLSPRDGSSLLGFFWVGSALVVPCSEGRPSLPAVPRVDSNLTYFCILARRSERLTGGFLAMEATNGALEQTFVKMLMAVLRSRSTTFMISS
ncbi:hypothetical protein Taro_011299, partial [Colocasia esculenta]|nr:hypothetical protein [Colocasia esculenta]